MSCCCCCFCFIYDSTGISNSASRIKKDLVISYFLYHPLIMNNRIHYYNLNNGL